MSLSAGTVARDMIRAAAGALEDRWPDARLFAETELRKLAQSLVMLARGVAKGSITPKAARALLEMNKNSARTVILTVEGLGLLAVEAALNAALKVVRDAVNTAAGFRLL
ncbi:MAG: hypothetical protein ACE5JG_06965 [Planctomycetota bacterium]